MRANVDRDVILEQEELVGYGEHDVCLAMFAVCKEQDFGECLRHGGWVVGRWVATGLVQLKSLRIGGWE